MKIIDWAIIFVLLATPVLWILQLHTGDVREGHRLQVRYTTALHVAVQDAASALNLNELQQYETGYGSVKYMRTDKDQALSAFIQTLSINFGIVDDYLSQGTMMAYIPAIVIIEYDGYSAYAVDLSAEGSNMSKFSHRWRPKKPYVYMDEYGNSIAFTLDDAITAYESSTGQWYRGKMDELQQETNIPLLQDARTFDQVRRFTIINSIQDDLAGYMNRHNEHAMRLGVNYTFTLPTLSQEDWLNTLNDVGVLVFLQGIPVGSSYYNNYAFGGGRVVQNRPLIGGVDDITGLKYQYREMCTQRYRGEQIFANRRDAAAKGYYEIVCP
ncbi:hypothetical protein [Paenibacillus lentus]|uniref:F0F1-type ATP synthase n=1 Tax=Paenibacillus lentus TaxID=1338368 RepID=A0A3S8RXF3_9BACL|nr:hypothetical protein [Paenibacillus lentus]AZK47387.1 hypothetical protein EIM92_15520 [Paenibacillus lentus]